MTVGGCECSKAGELRRLESTICSSFYLGNRPITVGPAWVGTLSLNRWCLRLHPPSYGNIKRLNRAYMQDNLKPHPHDCPRATLWLCHSVISTFGSTVCAMRDASVWVMRSCFGCCPLRFISDPPQQSSGPRPSPSLHIIQWPETRGPKTPRISFVFLMNPIFCLRAQGVHIHPS